MTDITDTIEPIMNHLRLICQDIIIMVQQLFIGLVSGADMGRKCTIESALIAQ